MSKFTPGPWLINDEEGHGLRSIRANDVVVAMVPYRHASGRVPPEDEAEANAILISAAPSLLAACKEIIRCDFYGDFSQPLLDEELADDGSHPRLHDALDAVRMAVARAEPL